MNNGKPWFLASSVGSFAVAGLHLIIIIIGASAYRYFGAGEEMAVGAEQGSFVPSLVTLGIVFVFIGFGLYALSGAGVIKKLWKHKIILMAITVIYLLRGTGFFIEIFGILYNYEVPVRHAVFSLGSLSIGVIHLIGLIRGWKVLP